MSMLTACGGGSEETSTDTAAEEVVEEEDTAEDSAADGMCSDETFSALQDNYASMVEAYNAVKDLYESDEIEADDSIEDVMNQAADVINEMGEISQDTITEEDAETLNSAMLDILDALSLLVDGMTETDASADAASEGCSDESFATLQDNFYGYCHVHCRICSSGACLYRRLQHHLLQQCLHCPASWCHLPHHTGRTGTYSLYLSDCYLCPH